MLLEVGHIVRAHGIKGEVVVVLVTDRLERLAPGSVLTGPQGPLTVTASRPHGDRYIVQFAGIVDRNAAEALAGAVLKAEPIDDPDVLWVHELIGCRLVDVAGIDHGEVVAVVANPASDLMELDSGALVPLRFVVSREPGRIVVDAPEGLFE